MSYYDIIIIGGGPAGLTAGLYAARANQKVLLLERTFAGGQIATTHELENYPGFPEGITGPDYSTKIEQQARKFNVEIVYEDVQEMHLSGPTKRIVTDAGEHIGRTVILAMGAQPRMIGAPGEMELRGRGVSYCATCDGAFFRDRTVAVIGGGDTACEEAEYLASMCKKVYLIHRRDQLRAVGVLADRVVNHDRVEIVWNATVDGITGDDMVNGVNIRDKVSNEVYHLPLDGVFVAVGVVPNTKLLGKQIKLTEGGNIVTDKYMHTNIYGVFAAGDIRDTPLRQVVTACADGAIAAESARQYLMEQA